MRRTTSLLALAAVTLVPAASPADAGAARSTAAKPKIMRVTPMRINVGETLVIRGSGFKSRPRANTVIFQGAEGRTAFAKPRRASRRKLIVKIPANVSRLLVVKDSRQAPTRLKLRVLAGRFSAFTPRRLSPVNPPPPDPRWPLRSRRSRSCVRPPRVRHSSEQRSPH